MNNFRGFFFQNSRKKVQKYLTKSPAKNGQQIMEKNFRKKVWMKKLCRLGVDTQKLSRILFSMSMTPELFFLIPITL